MSDNEIIVGSVTIVVFGVGAQSIGRRLGFPSLLLLPPAGLLAGDVFRRSTRRPVRRHAVSPGDAAGGALLFQSGLQLRLADLPRDARGPVLRLVGIGGTLTFLGAALAVLWILDVGADLVPGRRHHRRVGPHGRRNAARRGPAPSAPPDRY
jgi:NhaP-type Na+/H+ or K+/H+ antiporter